jgi:hypothetical protein
MLNTIGLTLDADGATVDLPEHPLRAAHLPPDRLAIALPNIPVLTAPRPERIEDVLGLEPPSESRISLGVPQSVGLTSAPSGDTGGLTQFLGATGASYFLVHLACSFDPIPGEHFIGASLAIQLIRKDDVPEPSPMAWSMEPRCLPHVTELSRTQRIDASWKLVGVSLAHEQQSTQTECLVRAFNELQANPRWDFRHAKGAPIVGTQRLIMVAQTAGPAVASVALTAKLRHRGLLRRERALVAGPRQFELRR